MHRNPHSHRSDPESTFDTWLDAFVAGTPASNAPQDDPSGPLAGAIAGARQLHGLAARAAVPGTAHQRIKEDLMQSGALAAPGGGRMWIPERTKEKRVPWWSPASPVLATAVAIAVLLGLVATLISTQRPVLSPTQSNAPGLAMASPGATPADSAMSCTAPGYLPIVSGNPSASDLAAIGLTDHAIVIGDDEATIPLPGGGERIVPKGEYVTFDPGVAVTHFDDGSSRVTRIEYGETWEFPPVGRDTTNDTTTTIIGNGRYYVAPTDDTRTNWYVLDSASGQRTTTEDILGEPFARAFTPQTVASSGDRGVAVFDFSRTATGGETTEASADLPGVLVIPASLDDAWFGVLSPDTTVSPDGSLLASYNEIRRAAEGELLTAGTFTGQVDGTFVGFSSDGTTLLASNGDELHSIDVGTGANGVLFQANAPIEAVALDTDAGTVAIGTGEQGRETWTLLQTGTGASEPLPALDGYQLYQASTAQPVTPVHGVAGFIHPTNDNSVNIQVLDMSTGAVSDVVAAEPSPEQSLIDAWPLSLANGFAITQDHSRGFTIVDPASASPAAIGKPDGVSVIAVGEPSIVTSSDPDAMWRPILSPDATCAALTNDYDDEDTSWIAPVETGATWTKIPFSIDGWLEMPPLEVPVSLPAQDFGTPVPTPAAPESTPDLADLFVVTDTSGVTPVVGGPTFATMNDKGLTLPIGANSHVTLAGVTDIGYIGEPGLALITRRDGTEAVIDLSTATELHEVPPLGTWGVDTLHWRMIPANDALTDWEIIDLRTGERRLLSSIVDLPADTAVMPASIAQDDVLGNASVFNIQQGRIIDDRFAASDVEAATFVIPDRLDVALQLPDYPSTRDATGSPALAVSGDGATLAYETRAGDDRIIIVDLATGTERMRVGVDQAGDDPSLAGFTSDGLLVASTGDRLITADWTKADPVATVADGFERLAYPLVYAPDNLVYAEQKDTLLRIDLESGEVTEVARGLMVEPFRFTLPAASWITFRTEGGQDLLDARTGEIVSQMPSQSGSTFHASFGSDADGDTIVVGAGMQRAGITSWILSPEFPDGLVLTGPDEGATYLFSVSRDGKIIYAKQDGYGEPGDLWMAPLATDLAWTRVAEDIDVKALFAIPRIDATEAPPPPQAPATPVATPEMLDQSSSVFVVESGANQARIEDSAAIATLDERGLTLPVASGKTTNLPDVTSVRYTGTPGQALITRADDSRAVIDLVTGDVLFDVPPSRPWEYVGWGYITIPTDDALTDWQIVDLATGDTRLLSDIVDLPGDTVMPSGITPGKVVGDAKVFRVMTGKIDGTSFVPGDPDVAAFVITGSLDHAVALPDYPTALENVGSPVLVASSDGTTVAYETRDSDCLTQLPTRIITLDVTTGEVLQCASSVEVSENPALAGFILDGQTVALSTGNGKLLMIGARSSMTGVVRGNLGRLDNPLFYTPESIFYVRESDHLLRMDLQTGEMTEVATGLVPGRFDFTQPGGNWIAFQTRDGLVLLDARTGEIVSRVEPPANRTSVTVPFEQAPGFVDADGDTVIVAEERPGIGPVAERSIAWIVSPDHPDGLEIEGPNPDLPANFFLSPDGETLYATSREQQSGPYGLWATPLGEEPDWQLVEEDFTNLTFVPLASDE